MPRRADDDQTATEGIAWFVQVITASGATPPRRIDDEQDARSEFARLKFHNTAERRSVILTSQKWRRGADGAVTWLATPAEIDRHDQDAA